MTDPIQALADVLAGISDPAALDVIEAARRVQTYLPTPDPLVAGRSEQMRDSIALDAALAAFADAVLGTP